MVGKTSSRSVLVLKAQPGFCTWLPPSTGAVCSSVQTLPKLVISSVSCLGRSRHEKYTAHTGWCRTGANTATTTSPGKGPELLLSHRKNNHHQPNLYLKHLAQGRETASSIMVMQEDNKMAQWSLTWPTRGLCFTQQHKWVTPSEKPACRELNLLEACATRTVHLLSADLLPGFRALGNLSHWVRKAKSSRKVNPGGDNKLSGPTWSG